MLTMNLSEHLRAIIQTKTYYCLWIPEAYCCSNISANGLSHSLKNNATVLVNFHIELFTLN